MFCPFKKKKPVIIAEPISIEETIEPEDWPETCLKEVMQGVTDEFKH